MPGFLKEFKYDLSHQEMDRIVNELDAIYGSQPTEWLPVEQIGNMLCHELGYEDMGEFEDAIHGSFGDYISFLPHVVVKEEDSGKLFFKIKPEPPEEEWKPKKLTYKIESTKDLWRCCMKSPHARVEIPELEFEVSSDGKRKIDSIYNHIASAVWNLGNYVKQNSQIDESDKNKICDTVIALNLLLDVEKPWTWVVHDPSGMSEIKPNANVVEEQEG